ncbi:MAG: RNA polymerase sigma factor [Thermoleophilaceae bacterium]|nr:RNA polymerase sigma factor [Thermoleophilaceae bacterium]
MSFLRETLKRPKRPANLGASDFARLYESLSGSMLVFFARRTMQPDAAVDLVAETFAAGFADRHDFRGHTDEQASAWLFGIARNQLSEFYRRGNVERRALNKIGVELQPVNDVDLERIEDVAGLAALRSQVAEELGGLSDEFRLVLQLRVVDELPYPEVAHSLGITEQLARARVSRALKGLRKSQVLTELKEQVDHA